MCRGLSYNLTSFPNIWLSISDQREAASILHKYRVRMKPVTLSDSSEPVCHLCDVTAGADGVWLFPVFPAAGVRCVCSSLQRSEWSPAAVSVRLLQR